jgi:hypothetical protein
MLLVCLRDFFLTVKVHTREEKREKEKMKEKENGVTYEMYDSMLLEIR